MRLCCYREKKYNDRRLVYVMTVAYTVQFGDTTTVTYSAIEWEHNGRNNWNKRKNFQYAKGRMQKKPMYVNFNNQSLQSTEIGFLAGQTGQGIAIGVNTRTQHTPPPSYYQYRRLEKFLVQEIFEHGFNKKQPSIGPEWVFDPVLTIAEQELEEKYSKSVQSRCVDQSAEPPVKHPVEPNIKNDTSIWNKAKIFFQELNL